MCLGGGAPPPPPFCSDFAVIATWIYCILWFFAQDACKRVAYIAMAHFMPASEKEKLTFARRHSAEYLDDANKKDPNLLPNETDLAAHAKEVAKAQRVAANGPGAA